MAAQIQSIFRAPSSSRSHPHMPTPMERLQRPLDLDSVARADELLYAAHKDDPRPNPLFNAQGNRAPLDPNNPAQADVQQEWCNHYTTEVSKSKGTTEAKPTALQPPSPERAPNNAVISCQIETLPIIFVPGIMGSRLRRAGTNGEGNGTDGLPNMRWDPDS